jgi:hypothetical protein
MSDIEVRPSWWPYRTTTTKATPTPPKAIERLDLMATVKEREPVPAMLPGLIETIKTTPFAVADERERLEAELEGAKKSRARLYPVEAEALAHVNKTIAEVTGKLTYQKKALAHGGKYLPISLEFLKWRDEDGYPKLCVFTLDDPAFAVTASSDNDWDVLSRSLPGAFRKAYEDVGKMLVKRARAKARSHTRVYLTLGAKFGGVIPESTRDKIKAAVDDFTRARVTNENGGHSPQVILIAEEKLEITQREEKIPAIPPGDPVAAIWDGSILWYIDDFDTSPVEEAALLVGPANPSA